jgi:glyoxylase-like metal-dependent hydrolase (beta-lactamase superfamily II)
MIFIKDQLEPNAWKIHEPWFAEHANLYVIRGSEKTLLIDAGLGLEHLPTWLKTQGIFPDMVVITHAHFDHCGGLHQFPSDRIFLTKTQAANLRRPELWGLDYLKSDQMAPACGHAGRVKNYRPIVPNAWNILGDAVDLGDCKLSVVDSPGHTDDSIVFFEKKAGWLFSGDVFYRGELYGGFPSTNVPEWESSLATINGFSPRTVFPGHNEPIAANRLPAVMRDSLCQLKKMK